MAYTLHRSVAYTRPDPGAWAALAEPKRMEMLRLVWAHELPAGQIAARFRVTFGAVSQHLAVLRSAGLVRTRRAGRQVFYAADRAALGPLAAALEALWSDKLATLKRLAEGAQRHTDAGRRGARPGATPTQLSDERRATHVGPSKVRPRASRTTSATRTTRETRQTRQTRRIRRTGSLRATHAARTRKDKP